MCVQAQIQQTNPLFQAGQQPPQIPMMHQMIVGQGQPHPMAQPLMIPQQMQPVPPQQLPEQQMPSNPTT